MMDSVHFKRVPLTCFHENFDGLLPWAAGGICCRNRTGGVWARGREQQQQHPQQQQQLTWARGRYDALAGRFGEGERGAVASR